MRIGTWVAFLLLVVLAASGCAGVLVAVGLGLERGRADLHERHDDSADGQGITFLERHPAQPADVVVMLHGFGGNKDHWTRFCGALPSSLWLIAPDLPGFGDSPRDPAASYDLVSQVERLHRFLTARGVSSFQLVGSSMGGNIAALYALRYPDDVESLVLFDPAGIPEPEESETKRLERVEGIHPLLVQSVADFDRLLALGFVTPPPIPDAVKGYFVESAVKNAPFTAKVASDMKNKPAPLTGRVHDIVPPTLVIWGDTDRIIHPSTARVWRGQLRDGLVVVLKATGHGPMMERPEETAQLSLSWWAERQVLGGQ